MIDRCEKSGMQLATSQRPHPPPVPPRPSRQVVAEALKRSPRPPCPTRQAPPPPNTKPWRSEDEKKLPKIGRTVVYDSEQRKSNNPKEFQPIHPSTPKCNEAIGTNAEKTVERVCDVVGKIASERKPENEERQRCDRENSQNEIGNTKDEKTVDNTDEKKSVNFKNFSESESESKSSKSLIFKQETEKFDCDEKIGKSVEDKSGIFDDGEKSVGRNDCLGLVSKKQSETPTNIEKISNNNEIGKVIDTFEENGETISGGGGGGGEGNGEEEEFVCAAAMSGSTTTISSDDCATVVIIDEPERKIAFNEDNDNIHHQDWLEAGVRYSSTKITLPADEPIDRNDQFEYYNDNREFYDEDDDIRRAYAQLDFSSIRERIAMSSLQGLPPLPRSLSGFNLSEGRREVIEPPPPPTRSSSKTSKNIKSTQPSSSRPSPPGRQLTTLDTQLAILRKEMFGLRQLDLSLLSQLWSLNESIQEFRQLLQEQEDRAPSPSPSSEEGDDNSYGSHPPPPPRRPAPLLHHHRPPRPPRPLRPPASDDSPSSEEYGAV